MSNLWMSDLSSLLFTEKQSSCFSEMIVKGALDDVQK